MNLDDYDAYANQFDKTFWSLEELDQLNRNQLLEIARERNISLPRAATMREMIYAITDDPDPLKTDVVEPHESAAASIIRSIENGNLDDHIKEIARACLERKKVIAPTAEEMVRDYLEGRYEPNDDPRFKDKGIDFSDRGRGRISAIKLYRFLTTKGLVESKQAVEAVIRSMGKDIMDPEFNG